MADSGSRCCSKGVVVTPTSSLKYGFRIKMVYNADMRLAFTIIELLVVISIIAILAAMLMPAIKMVKESADATKCMSNLRQISLATNVFANDHEGYLCPVDGWHYSDASKYWNNALADYAEDDAGAQNRGNFKKSSVQWGCPQWTRVQDAINRAGIADYWYFLTKDNQCGYAMNDAFATQSNDWMENGWWYIDNNHYGTYDSSANARWDAKDADPYPLLVQVAAIPYPTGQPLVHDGYLVWSHRWYQAYSSNPEMVIERHRSKGNIVYVDGHAGKVSGKQWQNASSDPWVQ